MASREIYLNTMFLMEVYILYHTEFVDMLRQINVADPLICKLSITIDITRENDIEGKHICMCIRFLVECDNISLH